MARSPNVQAPSFRSRGLLAAEAAILRRQPRFLARDVPALAANSRRSPEDVPRIELLLDREQAVVVGAPERLLEVGLSDVGLVEVRAGTWGDGPQLGALVPGDSLIGRFDVGRRAGISPAGSDDDVEEVIAPGRVHGVVDAALLLADYVVHDQGARLHDLQHGRDGLVERRRVLPVLGWEEPRARTQVCVGDEFGREVLRPWLVEVVVLEEVRQAVFDVEANCIPLRQKGCDGGLEICELCLGRPPGVELPGEAWHAVETRVNARITVVTLRRIGGESAPVSLDSSGEDLRGVVSDRVVAGCDVECQPGVDRLGVHLDSHAGNHAECASATSTDSPEDIRVVFLVGGDEATVR